MERERIECKVLLETSVLKKKAIGPPCPLGLVKVSGSEVLSFVVGLAYQGP
jgi:hypothetical protein